MCAYRWEPERVRKRRSHDLLADLRGRPCSKRPTPSSVPEDAYFFAAAAITGGEVTVSGLSPDALQGDVAFVHALERMGCQADWTDDAITVRGGKLRGIDIDKAEVRTQ